MTLGLQFTPPIKMVMTGGWFKWFNHIIHIDFTPPIITIKHRYGGNHDWRIGLHINHIGHWLYILHSHFTTAQLLRGKNIAGKTVTWDHPKSSRFEISEATTFFWAP
jgi:hypothetical protein